jgi:hypothetical protein
MSIFARSPYIVEISETGQDGSKLEVFIWNGTGSAPATPTYTLSKLIPASNNVKTYYNVSPYIREYITWNTRQEVYNTFTATDTSQWCNVQLKRYKLDSGTYTLLSTNSYVAYDGFGWYEQGYNYTPTYDILHDEGTFFYYYDGTNPSTNSSRRAGHIMVKTLTTYKAKYTNLVTAATFTQNLTNNSILDVPRVYENYYSAGNKLEIIINILGSDVTVWTGYFKPFELCRYTPVLCDFVNRYGCWQRTYFFAASNDIFSIENTEYNLMQSTFPNYNTLEGQRKVFNTTAKRSIKVNTDWVTESYNDLLEQLMTSERILLNSLPAKINTKQTELFKNINQKMINYTLEFDFAFNAINNVI